MEFAGIITEYDPFHNGHAAQIAAAKSAGAGCVAVCMSSGAVQRGGVPVSARECAGVRGAGCRGRFSHYIARTLRLCHSRAVCLRRGAAAGRAGVRYAGVRSRGPRHRPALASGRAAGQAGAGRPITGTAFHRHDLRRRTGRSRRRAAARGGDTAAHAQQHFGHRVLQSHFGAGRRPHAAGAAQAGCSPRRRQAGGAQWHPRWPAPATCAA